MDKILNLLKENDVEVTDELKVQLESIWPDTEGLLTQEKVNDIVESRLAREKNKYETQISDLKGKLENSVEPDRLNKLKNRIGNIRKDSQIKLLAAQAGVKDMDYFDYMIDKKGFKDKLKIEDENIYLTDSEGNYVKDEDGKKLGPEKIIEDLKEESPDIFKANSSDKAGSEFNKPNDDLALTKAEVENMSEEEINERWDEVKKIKF